MANKHIMLDTSKMERDFARILARYVKAVEGDADRETGRAAARIDNELTTQAWPRDTGISAGAWQLTRLGFAHYRLSNSSAYARVIEFGGYPGVGPKTIEISGTTLPSGIQINAGIYPKQRPAAPLRRSVERERRQLLTALRRALRRNWRK